MMFPLGTNGDYVFLHGVTEVSGDTKSPSFPTFMALKPEVEVSAGRIRQPITIAHMGVSHDLSPTGQKVLQPHWGENVVVFGQGDGRKTIVLQCMHPQLMQQLQTGAMS